MLNRTNRKLSANHLGLNLGTRSLATLAGVNLGSRPSHPVARLDAVRVGVRADRGDAWAGPIVIRSYPPMPMFAAVVSPTGSSPRPEPAKQSGWRAEPAGQTPELAARITTGTPRTTTAAPCRIQPQPPTTLVRQTSPSSRSLESLRTSSLSSIRLQVPDITP